MDIKLQKDYSTNISASNIYNNQGSRLKEICSMNFSSGNQIASSSFVLTDVENSFNRKEDTFKKCKGSVEPYCHVNLNSILSLKESTKQLLNVLEEIQTKVHSNEVVPNLEIRFSNIKTEMQCSDELKSTGQYVEALNKLKNHTQKLDAIYVKEEEDDCSVYKRLTRKCNCLNRPDYNDFIIHFNEDAKYTTSNLGEIIKNLRILKKFLYMGGVNTKNALMFLNEGLIDSQFTEKVELTLGCAHADICNIFDDDSIVTTCISWPCKYQNYGNYITQNLAAGFLYKLAEIEEGKRYLNYTSKITNDIKKVLRKRSSNLEIDIIDTLNATLSLLLPAFAKDMAVTYFSKSVYEGVGTRTIKDLLYHRKSMTLDEVFMSLDLLNKYSSFETGKRELTLQLPSLLMIFKLMIMEYNKSEFNIVITNTLNNIVSRNILKGEKPKTSKCWAIVDTATEPIKMKNVVCQMPPKKNAKKSYIPKLGLGVSPNKFRQLSKKRELESSLLINGSRKFNDLTKSMIVVPIENKQ